MSRATAVARALSLVVPGIAAVAVMLAVPPVPQDPAYHAFADQRVLAGVPNGLNVLSNAPLIGVGVFGLRALLRGGPAPVFRTPWERAAFVLVFTGVALAGVGSAWYHLMPSHERLVWDRAPIAIVATALLAIVVGERVDARAGRLLLAVLPTAGVASVVYWYLSERAGAGDLRPYGLAQFLPLVAIPLLLAVWPPAYTHGGTFLAALACYAVAKLFEHFDAEVLAHLGTVSGHTLKHLAAAAAAWCLVEALRRRRLA